MLLLIKKFAHRFAPFIKYCVVGVSGTVIDLVSLYIFVEYVHLPVLIGTIFSFFLAVINNFILNKIWTFQNPSKNYRKLFLKFLLVSVIGLGLTVSCMYILVTLLHIWYLFAKAVTSLIVLTWNFLANKYWTFLIKKRELPGLTDCIYDLSIIIPAYNEQGRIKGTLVSILAFLRDKKISAEIIVADDGSTDKTEEVVRSVAGGSGVSLSFLPSAKNYGKGFAIKRGVEKSRGCLILFTDADNSTPIAEYEKLKRALEQEKADIAIGSRHMNSSNVIRKQPFFRIAISRVGNFIISLFLVDGIKDTQCGFKLFTHHAAREIFLLQKVKRFAFDVEALVVADHLGYKVVEVPVSWINSTESRLRPIRDALITFKDLISIKLHLWGGGYKGDE